MKKSKKLLSAFLVLALAISFFGYVPIVAAINNTVIDFKENLSSTLDEADFAENRIIVLLSEEASKRKAAYSVADFSEIKSVKVENLTTEMYDYLIQKQASGTKSDKERIENFKHVLCVELATPGKDNVLNAIKTLQERNDVLYAGPDYVIHASSILDDLGVNDDEVDNQWAISNIHLDDAWNVMYNTQNVTNTMNENNTVRVGILDTGFDDSHEDLEDMVNMELSRDFTTYGINEEGPMKGHGTIVAGVIGAKSKNDKGIAGVCWNVELVSLQVIRNTGYGFSSDVYRAISYATQQEIPILNLSFGWSGDAIEERYDSVLDNIITSYGGLVVCSAGNENRNNNTYAHYPSNCSSPNIIAVGASTQDNARWEQTYMPEELREGSNYGSWSVDVFAPGYMIQTTILHNYYAPKDGTSLAAPFVAGIAALILSYHNDPTGEVFTGSVLKNILMNSVDVYSAFTGKCVTNGKINAYKAVTSDLAHKYTFSQYSMFKHKCSCACGDYYYENHDWNDAGTACEDCGFYPMGDV